MRKVMASGVFEWPEKVQNGLGWLRKYFFSGTILSIASYMFRYLCYLWEVLDCAYCALGPLLGRSQQKVMLCYIQFPALLPITSRYFDSCMVAAFGIL